MASRTVASVLSDYKQSEELTQEQLAGLLEISQPYVSLILSGKKTPTNNLGLILRICKLVRIDPAELGVRTSVLSNSNAELIYDDSLIALGSGDLTGAEIGLAAICGQAQYKSLDGLVVGDGLAARAQFRLANIRRDWNLIDGEQGSTSLYLSALERFTRDGATAYVIETNLFLGVCYEMSETWNEALKRYRNISHYSGENSLPVARAKNRCGAIFTKLGDYEPAEMELGAALSIARDSDAQSTYAFILEKLAILFAHREDYDKAMKYLQDSRTMLSPGEILRRLQNRVVEADVLYRQGSFDACERLLTDLLDEARSHHFGHQEKWIAKFSERMTSAI